MTRIVSTANATALAAARVRLFVAVYLDFSSGAVRAHDGIGTVTFGGNDYLGLGQFGGIELAEESVEVIAKPVTMKLSGIETGLLSSAMTEVYQGRTATVYLGLQDTETGALIDTPETVWSGKMDQMTVALKPNAGEITLRCEHRLRREPKISRYTDADMQLAYSGDRFFDLIGKIAGFKGTWGAKGNINDGSNLSVPVYNASDYYNWQGY